MSFVNIALPEINFVRYFPKSGLIRALFIWFLAAFFYFYDNLLQISPSAMKPELSLAFAKEAEQFGSLSAYCLYAYGLMQIPAGLLMDRFGPRRILTVACAFCGGGSLIFGIASTLWEAKIGRVMIGIGAAFAFIGCLKIISHWFSAKRFAFMIGLTVTVGFLGAVFGLSTVSKIVEIFGWRETMKWGGILGLSLSALLWLVIRDKNPNDTLEIAEAALDTKSSLSVQELWQGLLSVLKHKQTWIAALYAGLMFVPTLAFGGLWGVPFLVEAHGFSRASAGVCISLIYVGWMFGGPFWGFVSDFLQNRNKPMLIGTLVSLVICCAVLYLQQLPLQVLGSLLFGLGFFSSAFILAFAVVQESNPPSVAGTALGFTNALNTLWGALAQPCIGKILDLTSRGITSVDGEQVFTLAQYQQALVLLPISLITSIFLLFYLKEVKRT